MRVFHLKGTPVLLLLFATTLFVQGCGEKWEKPIIGPPPDLPGVTSQKSPGWKPRQPKPPEALTDLKFTPDPTSPSKGPAPRIISESTRTIRRGTPKELLESVLEAFQAKDIPALARASRPHSDHPTLNEDDAWAARRRFLHPQGRRFWENVATSINKGTSTMDTSHPDRAHLRVQMGGALGTITISLRKERNAWFLDG